jgi:hypothetical protein
MDEASVSPVGGVGLDSLPLAAVAEEICRDGIGPVITFIPTTR